jgi:hypothetical protein
VVTNFPLRGAPTAGDAAAAAAPPDGIGSQIEAELVRYVVRQAPIGFAIGIPLVLFMGQHPVHLVSQEMRSSLEVFGLEPLIMFSLSKSQLVGLPLVLIAVGLLAAVLPAIRASRGRPVDALRET